MNTRHLTGALVAGTLMWAGMVAGASHALASDVDHIDVAWAIPGSPTSDPLGDVWAQPQTLATPATCGVWEQVDRYLVGPTTDALLAGGVLYGPGNPAEALDYAHPFQPEGQPYKYVKAPDCKPTKPPQPEPKQTTHTERHIDCDLDVAIVLTETVFTTYVWNESTWTWDEVVTSKSNTEQAPLTKEEAATCPKPSPTATPTPSPTKATPEPTPSSPTSIKPSPESVPTPSTPPTTPKPHLAKPTEPELAATGTSGVIYLVIALGLVGLGTALVLTERRNNND